MRIGTDFDKIEWEIFGLEFLEPNALLGDIILGGLALFFAYKMRRMHTTHGFFKKMSLFYIIFGVGFVAGGLGHFLFNYTGIPGKYASWYAGIVATFFLERALLTLFRDEKRKIIIIRLINGKFILAMCIETAVLLFGNLQKDPAIGLIVPTVNTFIGFLYCLGYLGFKYEKEIHPSFRFLWISVLVLLPSVFFQAFKINLHPWLDKNDFSHLLLIISISLYFLTVSRYAAFVDTLPKQPIYRS